MYIMLTYEDSYLAVTRCVTAQAQRVGSHGLREIFSELSLGKPHFGPELLRRVENAFLCTAQLAVRAWGPPRAIAKRAP